MKLDLSYNWCGHGGPITKQHWPKKGMGGNNSVSRVVAALCWECHDLIDNTLRGGNVVDERGYYQGWVERPPFAVEGFSPHIHRFEQFIGVAPVYTGHYVTGWRVMDSKGVNICRRDISGGEAGYVISPTSSLETGSEVAILTDEASLPGNPPVGEAERGEWGNEPLDRTSDPAMTPLPASFSEWEREVRQLAIVGKSLGFMLGDKIVYGEDAFGEDRVWAVLDELGMAFETLANMASVCRAFPVGSRRHEVSFSVYQALAPCQRREPERAAAILERVVAEGLSSRDVRAIVAPPVAREVRYTVIQLKGRLDAFQCQAHRNHGRRFTQAFLESLE